MPIDPSMDGNGQKSESPAQRTLRIAWLREAVASGNYFVPAEVVARSLLRRLVPFQLVQPKSAEWLGKWLDFV